MIDNLGGVTSDLLRTALDAALLRHRVIAHNIANVDTPGYRAKRLTFEQHLAGATDSLGASETGLAQRLEMLKGQLRQDGSLVVTTAEAVELDGEMVRIAENTLRYHALLDASGKRGELVKMAIAGGRR
ncbi:flagellar basal body rod protein FlgB [Exilibacterium tricleocarpae]|uniref:Flagellar basal body rod protein FlgB n=1 Tax=Exilibacterium tricleocarpae TaxID=2591008 RepID=A0A545T849_9GAMM|nr:flagellar basal body rod protein FlgB [Exilibacterium tricleocarpae]TQV73407.1 flagellar basal body rod protein FlgB [Exilibacterium tricleocarpae]